jgi:citrate-Mg2+:H+ or citrate-Ca2+:H+ symporter, CitMHS family
MKIKKKLLLGTAILSAAVSLNGDGTTTTLIVCSAFIPIYKKLGLKMMNLAVVLIVMNTIMNLLPWGGPTARAISVLKLNEQTVLRDLAPGMVVSIIYMFFVAFYLGVKERKRIGVKNLTDQDIKDLTTVTDLEESALRRPKKV